MGSDSWPNFPLTRLIASVKLARNEYDTDHLP